MSKNTYILIELGKEGPRFSSASGPCDSWICEWAHMDYKVKDIIDVVEDGDSVEMKFTVMEMTYEEFQKYCEEHEVEMS